MVNPNRIFGIMLIAASIVLVTTGSHDAMAQSSATSDPGSSSNSESQTESQAESQPEGSSFGDVIVEEVVEAEKTTMTAGGTNQTAEPTFLFIQNAQSGSISEINATAYSLELDDVSDKTILSSDRPDRIVTSVSTSDFIGNWTTGPNSFVIDPPNAVLVFHDDEERQDIAIIELFNPIYDTTQDSLKYDIIPEAATSIDLPTEFGQSTLVIDSTGNIATVATVVPGKEY